MIDTATEPTAIEKPGIDGKQSILMAVLLVVLFVPVLRDILPMWLTEEQAGHCIFIIPLAVAMLWLRRQEIAEAPREPKPVGLAIMAAGVACELGAYFLRVHFLEVWAFVPILAGFVYLFYGPSMLKITRFSIFLVLLLMPLPTPLFKPISLWIRAISTVGATRFVDLLGYPVLQQGNVIQIPGMTVEVATVCSGFNKFAVLVTTALIYGYLFDIGYVRRGLLVLAAVPIAILANIIRIAIVMLVCYYGGERAFHVIHTYSEFLVIAASFALFVAVGNLLGCKNLRFTI